MTDRKPGERGEGKATQERRERGRMSLHEAARALGRHRDTVRRWVEQGRLAQDAEGTLDADEVIALDEEIRAQRDDPAITQLKGTLDLFESHFQRLTGGYFSATERALQILAAQNEQLQKQNESLNKVLVENATLHRQVLDGSAERELAKVEVEQTTKNQAEFLSTLKAAAASYFQAKSPVVPKLRDLVSSMTPDQLLKLSDVLTEQQQAALGDVLSAIDTKEGAGAPH